MGCASGEDVHLMRSLDVRFDYDAGDRAPSSLPVRDFMVFAASRWKVLALAVILGIIASLGFAAMSDPVYRSTETLVVGPAFDSSAVASRDLQASERVAASYASLAKDGQFLSEVISGLGLEVSPGELAERVELTVIPTTQLLTVSSVAETPEEAEAVTDAVARQLEIVANGTGEPATDSEVSSRLESLEARIAAAELRVENLTSEVQEAQNRLQLCLASQESDVIACSALVEFRDLLTSELQQQETLLGTLESNYLAALNVAGAAENAPGRVTRLADGPGNATPVTLGTALSALVGAFAGMALALLLIYFAWTSRTRGGALPGVPIVSVHRSQLQMAADDPYAPNEVLGRSLEAVESITAFEEGLGPRSVVVLDGSAQRGELAQLYALHLARKLAGSGLKTVLIDAVLAKPHLHRVFGVGLSPGLAELVTGKSRSLEMLVQYTDVSGLSLLSAGWLDDSPDSEKVTIRLGSVFDELAQYADGVVAAVSWRATDPISRGLARRFRSGVVMTTRDDRVAGSQEIARSVQSVVPDLLYVVEVEGTEDPNRRDSRVDEKT